MSTKKLIVLTLITLLLFFLLLIAAFNSIQKTDTIINTTSMKDDSLFKEEITFLNKLYHEKLFEEFKLDAFNILVINHRDKQAMMYDGQALTVKYDDIPEQQRYGNSYYTIINNKPTLMINNDSKLGDIRVRIITQGYKATKLSVKNLTPENFEYYTELHEQSNERYLRSQMIKSLMLSIRNESEPSEFKFYYETWKETVGENYTDITYYDLYEGKKLFVLLLAKSIVKNFDNDDSYMEIEKLEICVIEQHVDPYIQSQIIIKENEYALIGLLLQYYVYDNQLEIKGSMDQLLSKIPIRSLEIDTDKQENYLIEYKKYLEDISEIISEIDFNKPEFSYEELTGEQYDKTFHYKDNYYIYSDYYALKKDGSIVQEDFVIVKVEPYRIKYYIKNK